MESEQSKVTRPETGAAPEPSGMFPEKKPKLLVFLFSLIPGAGLMYLGCMRRGVQLMALFFGSLYATLVIGGPLDQLWPVFIAPVVWFYSFFDALQTANKLARGQEVNDEPLPFFYGDNMPWGKLAGWVLIGLGTLALLNSLGYWIFGINTLIRRFLGPLVLLGLGAWLLLRDDNGVEEKEVPVRENVDRVETRPEAEERTVTVAQDGDEELPDEFAAEGEGEQDRVP